MPDYAPFNPEAVPVSREQLQEWYDQQQLSLQEIADRATEMFGQPINRAKVREWLLILHIPRRSFSQAARVRFQKQRAAQDFPPASQDFPPPSSQQCASDHLRFSLDDSLDR